MSGSSMYLISFNYHDILPSWTLRFKEISNLPWLLRISDRRFPWLWIPKQSHLSLVSKLLWICFHLRTTVHYTCGGDRCRCFVFPHLLNCSLNVLFRDSFSDLTQAKSRPLAIALQAPSTFSFITFVITCLCKIISLIQSSVLSYMRTRIIPILFIIELQDLVWYLECESDSINIYWIK